jgi:hypothetical protein
MYSTPSEALRWYTNLSRIALFAMENLGEENED